MCQRVNCRSCGMPTFAGCGMHVEQVLGNVPHHERCSCHLRKADKTDAESAESELGAASLWRRLLG